MKILIDIFLLMLVSFSGIIPFNNAYSKDSSEETNKVRLYVIMGGIGIAPGTTKLIGNFSSIDGNSFSVDATKISSYFSTPATLDNKFFMFDVAKKCSISYFNIKTIDETSTYTTTNLYEISGSVFHLNTNNYTVVDQSSGWSSASLSMIEFASYVLASLDPYSESFLDGYNSFSSIKKSFFNSLIDYEYEKGNQITWDDPFLEKKCSFNEKWEFIENQYKKFSSKNASSIWPYFVGGGLLLVSVASFVGFIWKKKEK